MTRQEHLRQLEDPATVWDIIVIGGGATGLGAAVEAASRGYRTLLLEQSDFAKGTSSRSTKLIHGGVRYLRQGNISLVMEALHERGILIRNAPHLVHNLSFVVPLYDWWEGPFYGIGLKLYDTLAGKLGLGPSRLLSREETLRHIPTVEPAGLRGGVIYHDGQFDDARLAISLARTCAGLGGIPLNYLRVTGFTWSRGLIDGVEARDQESSTCYRIRGKAVINAAGVFSDAISQLDDPAAPPQIRASQGTHLVLDRSFLPGDSAIMVPHTTDGRILFAVPWHNRTIVGTTDTPVEKITLEPRPLAEEIDFLLTHAARYLSRHPTPDAVLSVFAGLRPLATNGGGGTTAALSRDHAIHISGSGLVTVTGGKWTTYRRMGEDAIDKAVAIAGLPERPSVTTNLRIHGWREEEPGDIESSVYGSDTAALEKIIAVEPDLGQPLHPDLPYRLVEVVWAVRHEWARTVEDVLSRRTRALLLDARASMEAAPRVAALMARELGHDRKWVDEQTSSFLSLAAGYLISGNKRHTSGQTP